jgi:uridine kinase
MHRSELLAELAARIAASRPPHPLRVGIDGVDAAGKTTLANELVPHVEATGRQVIRASIDGFHNVSAVRYRRGRESAEGYYLDSFDAAALAESLLEPFGPEGDRRFRRAVFDHRSDSPLDLPLESAAVDAVLLFDGVFLHRPELRRCWDLSVFLDVDFSVAVARALRRDPDTPGEEARRLYRVRYVPGQQLYLERERPAASASIVIDNTHPERPTILRADG